jgi:hypothetical protein
MRLRALARLGEMADRGDFDEFLRDKTAYRKPVPNPSGEASSDAV